MKLISVFLYFIIQSCFAQETQTKEPHFEDISIVVFSCDKYQELWQPFFDMLFKQWPSLKTTSTQVPIYLVANSKKYEDKRVKMVNIQNEKSWSDNALTVLALVKTKYVLVLLEDYFFTHINTKRLHEVIEFMKSEDVAYCQIADNGTDINIRKKSEVFPGVAEKDRFELWRTSLYACIWRTKDMAHTLKPGESIWDFEVAGTVRSQGLYGKFLTIFENQPVRYLNMVQQRYLNSANVKIIKDMGVTFNRGKLELDSDHKIKLFFYYKVFTPFKEYIKIAIEFSKNLLRDFIRKAIPSFGS